jgi:hypothetical protein
MADSDGLRFLGYPDARPEFLMKYPGFIEGFGPLG